MNKAIADSNFQKALDHFDFKTVHEIMEMMDWKWGTRRGYETPTQLEMIQSVMGSYKACDDVGRVSSGGFEVEIDKDSTVYIRFIAHESMWMQEFDQEDGEVSNDDEY